VEIRAGSTTSRWRNVLDSDAFEMKTSARIVRRISPRFTVFEAGLGRTAVTRSPKQLQNAGFFALYTFEIVAVGGQRRNADRTGLSLDALQ